VDVEPAPRQGADHWPNSPRHSSATVWCMDGRFFRPGFFLTFSIRSCTIGHYLVRPIKGTSDSSAPSCLPQSHRYGPAV
jgi:hypothetical protein